MCCVSVLHVVSLALTLCLWFRDHASVNSIPHVSAWYRPKWQQPGMQAGITRALTCVLCGASPSVSIEKASRTELRYTPQRVVRLHNTHTCHPRWRAHHASHKIQTDRQTDRQQTDPGRTDPRQIDR